MEVSWQEEKKIMINQHQTHLQEKELKIKEMMEDNRMILKQLQRNEEIIRKMKSLNKTMILMMS